FLISLHPLFLFLLIVPHPPSSTRFPYTTLFRSRCNSREGPLHCQLHCFLRRLFCLPIIIKAMEQKYGVVKRNSQLQNRRYCFGYKGNFTKKNVRSHVNQNGYTNGC